MPKVIEPFKYGRDKFICPKCRRVHLYPWQYCQNPKCKHFGLEKVKDEKQR